MSSLSPAPHGGSPEMVPVLGLARSVPGLAGSSAPVPAADPRTFGGDLWHSVAPLCGGAILPELYPGLLRTGTMLPIGASHAGAHPSDASALCQMLLQDAGPSAGHHLDAPPGWPCHKRRHGDTVTAGRCCLLPMMTPAQQPAAHSLLTRLEPSSAPWWLALPRPGALVCRQHHTAGVAGGPSGRLASASGAESAIFCGPPCAGLNSLALNFRHLAHRQLAGCSARLLPLGTRLALELREDHGAGFAAFTQPGSGAWPWVPRSFGWMLFRQQTAPEHACPLRDGQPNAWRGWEREPAFPGSLAADACSLSSF